MKWPKGKHMIKLRAKARKYKDEILNGSVVAVDPASRSAGYAISSKGKITKSGEVNGGKELLHKRLRKIRDFFYRQPTADIAVIEMIRGARAHAYLSFAVGAIMSGLRVKEVLEIPSNVWQAVAPEDYEKTDEGDARLMLQALLMIAREEDND